MRLPQFDYLEPTTMKEALTMLHQLKGKVRVLGGGTEIVPSMKLGLVQPQFLMSLSLLKGLDGIKESKDHIAIGSGTLLRELLESPTIKILFPGIVEAAMAVAAPPIRNRATVAGNILQNTRCLFYNQSQLFRQGLEPCFKRGGKICHAAARSRNCLSVYQGDLAPSLISFSARVRLESSSGTRILPMESLFTGIGKRPTSISEEELLTRVIIPRPKHAYGSAFQKLTLRSALDYSFASSAVFVSAKNGVDVSSARIVLGAASRSPMYVKEAGLPLIGKIPTEADIDKAADAAYRAAALVNNLSLPAAYCRKMIRVLTKRAIQKALHNLAGDKQ